MAFHVFVEGATDATPAGVERLANAIAKHYGLPAADLLGRLQKGRFRVKGNIDRETADKYRRDLEILGARCTVEEANAQNSQRATPLPFPAVRPATPPAGVQQYQSGLAAAFSGQQPAASLGALEKDNMSFSLASVDGADDQPAPSAAAFAPPEAAMSASIGPPPEKPKAAKPEKPKDVPLDLFAPPDAQGDELKVDIALDEKPKRQSAPAIPVPAEPASRRPEPSLQTPNRAPSPVALAAAVEPKRGGKLGPLGDPRARFAVGVLLAVLIGFVPAHLVAATRERSAFEDVDGKVIAAQQLADTPEAYATLDRMRADQLRRKESEKRNAAIIAFAIWALVGGGIAFAWFKKIPWDRLE
jgi:hypothetical protein